jgi:hypothetical protein
MSMENNLLNIRTRDPVFLPVARRITERVLRVLTDEEARLLLKAYPQIPVIAADNYFLHYSALPRLRSDDNPDKLLNEVLKAQREYAQSKQYSAARMITKLSDTLASIHAVAFTKTFVEQLLEELRRKLPPQQYQQLMEQLRQQASQLGGQGGQQQQPQQSQQGQGGGASQQQAQQGQAQPQPQQGAQQPQQGQNQQGEQSQQQQGQGQFFGSGTLPPHLVDFPVDSSGVGRAFRRAQEEAERAARTAKDVDELLGLGAGKEPGTLDLLLDLTNSVMEVRGAERILSLAKKIVDAAPFFVHRKKERDRRFGDEIAGYYMTKSVERALPRELALPDEVFYAKLAGSGLLAREKLTVREGAIYMLLDKSGSMEGEKTVWARSVALALLALARRKRTRFLLRFFDTYVYDLVSDEEPGQLLNMILKTKSNGGTSIDGALRAAIKDLRERGLSKYTNTIILVTDGEDTVTTKREELQAVSARLVSVMIQGDNDTLRAISDQYLKARLSEHGALRLIEVVR